MDDDLKGKKVTKPSPPVVSETIASSLLGRELDRLQYLCDVNKVALKASYDELRTCVNDLANRVTALENKLKDLQNGR